MWLLKMLPPDTPWSLDGLTAGEADFALVLYRQAFPMLGGRCKKAEMIGGDVDSAPTAKAAQYSADIPIMGPYGHWPLRSMIVGSTTTAMVRALTLPVLLFR